MNKNKIYIAALLISISIHSIFGFGKPEIGEDNSMDKDQTDTVSGILENGLRIVQVDMDKDDLLLTVYRGDYIVFDIRDNLSHQLIIPSLDIKKQIPVPADETPYIKMKESGNFEFTIDSIKGFLRVIDFEGPRYWEITSKEAVDLIKNIRPFILDVRTEGEYQQGHLENSFLIPVQVLESEIGLIEKYKEQDILIYCRSGNRSTVAAKILLDAGFTNVYNLRYGINEWISNGYTVVVE